MKHLCIVDFYCSAGHWSKVKKRMIQTKTGHHPKSRKDNKRKLAEVIQILRWDYSDVELREDADRFQWRWPSKASDSTMAPPSLFVSLPALPAWSCKARCTGDLGHCRTSDPESLLWHGGWWELLQSLSCPDLWNIIIFWASQAIVLTRSQLHDCFFHQLKQSHPFANYHQICYLTWTEDHFDMLPHNPKYRLTRQRNTCSRIVHLYSFQS